MATKRSHAFTKRLNGGETAEFKKQRIKQLKSMGQSLTQEQIEELRILMGENNGNY